ncbi:hypothetical protein [Metabacillus iocasae]|uniref:Uncharacterized protein n=1 Tax=Priestia iocasae TaxID=2291674 RepID=A0ABS2QXD5_9BACI|nr:hypothetical protein [Metabacillus iocasae]MBM7704145.1 hypothetical protein [Metabacillus iocasae]
MKSEKPIYFDGRGIEKREEKENVSVTSKNSIVTEEMRKQISGNPYIAKNI